MFKNVPYFKTICGNKNASETFSERQRFSNYLIQFFINNYEKASQNLFQLENICFTCSDTGFLLFLSLLRRKLAIQICFSKVASEDEKKLKRETFFKLSKMNPPMDVFIILQLSRSVRVHLKSFSGENKERKATLLQETQADQIS